VGLTTPSRKSLLLRNHERGENTQKVVAPAKKKEKLKVRRRRRRRRRKRRRWDGISLGKYGQYLTSPESVS
jgi:hypothetical protein